MMKMTPRGRTGPPNLRAILERIVRRH